MLYLCVLRDLHSRASEGIGRLIEPRAQLVAALDGDSIAGGLQILIPAEHTFRLRILSFDVLAQRTDFEGQGRALGDRLSEAGVGGGVTEFLKDAGLRCLNHSSFSFALFHSALIINIKVILGL